MKTELWCHSNVSPSWLLGHHRCAVLVAGWLLGEETDGGVGPRGKDPGLCGVKGHVEDAQVVGQDVSTKNLHWDDERVLEQVTKGGGVRTGGGGVRTGSQREYTSECVDVVLLVHCPMTHDDRPVVRGRGEQRVRSVIGHAPHRLLMVSTVRKRAVTSAVTSSPYHQLANHSHCI